MMSERVASTVSFLVLLGSVILLAIILRSCETNAEVESLQGCSQVKLIGRKFDGTTTTFSYDCDGSVINVRLNPKEVEEYTKTKVKPQTKELDKKQ